MNLGPFRVRIIGNFNEDTRSVDGRGECEECREPWQSIILYYPPNAKKDGGEYEYVYYECQWCGSEYKYIFKKDKLTLIP